MSTPGDANMTPAPAAAPAPPPEFAQILSLLQTQEAKIDNFVAEGQALPQKEATRWGAGRRPTWAARARRHFRTPASRYTNPQVAGQGGFLGTLESDTGI